MKLMMSIMLLMVNHLKIKKKNPRKDTSTIPTARKSRRQSAIPFLNTEATIPLKCFSNFAWLVHSEQKTVNW